MKNFIIILLIGTVIFLLTRHWLLSKAAVAANSQAPAGSPGSAAVSGPTGAGGWPIVPANGIAAGLNTIQIGVTGAGAPVYVNTTAVTSDTVPQSGLSPRSLPLFGNAGTVPLSLTAKPALNSLAKLKFAVAPGLVL
jgi:hypothetical protein